MPGDYRRLAQCVKYLNKTLGLVARMRLVSGKTGRKLWLFKIIKFTDYHTINPLKGSLVFLWTADVFKRKNCRAHFFGLCRIY